MTRVTTTVGPIDIAGNPSEAEVAAIVAAIEMSWPKPAPPRRAREASQWRLSSRWWSAGRLPPSWR